MEEESSSTNCFMEKPVDPSNRFVNLTDVVYLNGSTDYVEGYCFYNSTGSVIAYSSDGNSTFMSGVLVRAD